MNILRILSLSGIMVFILSCSNKYQTYPTRYNIEESDTLIDYRNLSNWAAHPWKKDPSDSIPRDIKIRLTDTLVDVFFIHPTTYTGTMNGMNASIQDSNVNAKTDYSSILYQASAFNQHARVFSPRYRQAHLTAFFADNDATRSAFDSAYADIRKAFIFYLEHFHNNRPIIIAGHSQGAKMAQRLLQEFFDGQPLQQKLVVAYIIGWPIPQKIFQNIKVCKTAAATGCFCGWRTYRKDFIPLYVLKETTTSYVTNPLSWTDSSKYAGRNLNKGSVLRDFNKIVYNTTDAWIHKGVLWVTRPKFPGSVFLNTKNYHIADINLFYMNLRENIEERIFSFLAMEGMKVNSE